MDEIVKTIIEKIKSYNKTELDFTEYCKRKMLQRNIDEETTTSALLCQDLLFVETQEKLSRDKKETRYKLVYKISSKYYLIIVVVFYERVIKIINVIKTSKNMEKKWQKKILK